ncbi:MAG: hypothetical protein KDB74_01400 [Flavobacteriales bacterium]|nr:hypothetical protein [Flavobacteriales bacterium]
MFDTLVKKVNIVAPLVWHKDELYISRDELHSRIMLTLGIPLSKRKDWKFCRQLKAAIKASILCREVKLQGYNKYKRLD